MSKVYVIAGNNSEFVQYRAKKYTELNQAGVPVPLGHWVNVSSHNVIRGTSDPHGVFIGTWRDRLDINDILSTISVCSRAPSPAIDKLRQEISTPIKPTPKIVGKTATQVIYDEAVNMASKRMADEIDAEVLKTLRNQTNTPAVKGSLATLLGVANVLYDSDTNTVTADKWLKSYCDEL
jgi:hypothetical protein